MISDNGAGCIFRASVSFLCGNGYMFVVNSLKRFASGRLSIYSIMLSSINCLCIASVSVSVSNEILPIRAHLLDWSNKTQCHYIPIVNTIQHQCIYTSHVIYIVHIHVDHIKYSFKR